MGPASGTPEVVAIGGGPIEVELLPAVGGRLHRLRVFGHDLLRTPDDPAEHMRDPFLWGAYVMAPWCNRIAARTDVGSHLVRLGSNSEDGTAIHGLVYDAPWHMRDDQTLWVRGGGDGWPWPFESTLRITSAGAVLAVEQSLTNLAETPMPAGLGLHPWFRRPLDICIAAERVLPSNTDPGSDFEPVSGPLDLRVMRPMPGDLDAAWLSAGDPAVEVRWPKIGIAASVRARSAAGLFIAAASPSRLDAVAIEPQTHAPQGLRRFVRGEPGGLQALAPGATLRLGIELAFWMS